ILEVELGYGGKSLVRQTYTLEKSHATHGTVIARLWAQQKLGRLAAFPEKNSEKILALGKYYNLVTPRTSLIVLESLSQYIEHDIRPPASLKKMRAKFDENAQSLKKRLAIENESKLERIIKLWEGRKAWWNKVFEHKVIKPKAKPKKMMAQPRRSRRSEASKSMAAPSSAPMGAMAEEMESDAPAEMKKEAAGGPSDGPSIAIELKKWEPDTPYLRKMKAAKKDEAYNIYLSEKGGYGSSPAFYLDCADFFYTAKMDKIALRVLSTVAELKLEDAALIRVLAHRLAQLEHYEESRLLFEQVLQWRPEEPQSWRDLALVLDKSGKYERAMELLAHVVMKRWDRFNEIELIALMELNNIIPRAKKAGITHFPIDKRLIALLDVDIRISLSWDADLTDIDMWVIEPSGEKAYYGHRNTRIGGLVSRDFTQGYGPEEYLIHRAMKGTYKVQTNYFGSGAQTLTGAVTLQLELFTNYGRPNEQRQAITLRLSENKETITVGELKF
ncbi:DUF2135 domain-containing protein, partial [Myxococcota bacterium]|nr:DUF2135 domain-containing protein [Myxococcota bacterium]